MLSIPNLPTDSLYKFIFLGGLFLMIYSTYLIQDQKTQVSRQYYVTDSLSIVHESYKKLDSVFNLATEHRLKTIGKDLQEANLLYIKMVRKKRNVKEIDIISEQVKRYRRELIVNQIRLDSLMRKYTEQGIEFKLKFTEGKTRLDAVESNLNDAKIYAWIGLILFSAGGFLWYVYIQSPQDKLQKIQLKIATLELEEKLKLSNLARRDEIPESSRSNTPSEPA